MDAAQTAAHAESGVVVVPSSLKEGVSLASGGFLKSPNGEYLATLQGDGNLLVQNRFGDLLWASNKYSPQCTRTPPKMIIQADSNLVVYCGVPIFATETAICGASLHKTELHILDNGNLVLGRVNRGGGDPVQSGSVFWETGTADDTQSEEATVKCS